MTCACKRQTALRALARAVSDLQLAAGGLEDRELAQAAARMEEIRVRLAQAQAPAVVVEYTMSPPDLFGPRVAR